MSVMLADDTAAARGPDVFLKSSLAAGSASGWFMVLRLEGQETSLEIGRRRHASGPFLGVRLFFQCDES